MLQDFRLNTVISATTLIASTQASKYINTVMALAAKKNYGAVYGASGTTSASSAQPTSSGTKVEPLKEQPRKILLDDDMAAAKRKTSMATSTSDKDAMQEGDLP